MTDITIVRELGDKPGDDILDELLSSDLAARARGTAEIDGATPASIVDLECRFRSDIEVGNLVEVVDPDQGSAYRAQVIGVTITAGAPVGIGLRLRLWRPV